MGVAVGVAAPDGAVAPMMPLLRELGDLKRIRSAEREGGTIASRLFATAWSDLVKGRDVRDVAIETTADAIARTRLGDLDWFCLTELELPGDAATEVIRAAIRQFDAVIPPGLQAELIGSVAEIPDDDVMSLPPFVEMLRDQPRAGVTCPGKPRIILQPAENHAEHCLVVAVYGVLLSQRYGADPATVFLASLAHHLHNAAMPDAGFTGEMLLARHLGPLTERATAEALAGLTPDLRTTVEEARRILADADTPEGRAFNAADVIDRVLEIEQHLRAARLTMADVLGDMALVHDGPVKPFHDGVLREMGLA